MLMGWGVMCLHQKLFFQPNIFQQFIFVGGFLWIWKRQRQVVVYFGAWKPPKLALRPFLMGRFTWAMCGLDTLAIFKTFLSSNSELPHKVITCFFSHDLGRYLSVLLLWSSKNITCDLCWSFFENHGHGFLYDVFFFFPSPSGGWKADDHRLTLQLLSQVGAVYCDVVSSTGPEARWAQLGWLIRKTKHEKFVLSCKKIFFIFSSLPDFNTQWCVRRGCVFFVFLCCFMIILRNNNQRNSNKILCAWQEQEMPAMEPTMISLLVPAYQAKVGGR